MGLAPGPADAGTSLTGAGACCDAVILDGADLGRCFRDPAYRFRAVVDAGREANVHRAANIDSVHARVLVRVG